jgi:dihydrofolate reductase
MILSSIVAVAQNGVIGNKGTLPWKISSDLKWFKEKTSGHCIIMGRKNYEDIGRPLPNRYTIILSRQGDYAPELSGKGEVVRTPGEALAACRRQNDVEPFIIGGAEIYKLFAPQVKRWYLTEVNAEVEGDVYLEDHYWKGWKVDHEESFEAGEKDQYPFTLKILNP